MKNDLDNDADEIDRSSDKKISTTRISIVQPHRAETTPIKNSSNFLDEPAIAIRRAAISDKNCIYTIERFAVQS